MESVLKDKKKRQATIETTKSCNKDCGVFPYHIITYYLTHWDGEVPMECGGGVEGGGKGG